MSLQNLFVDSPIVWVAIGSVVCISWQCVGYFFRDEQVPLSTHPVIHNETPSESFSAASAMPEVIPEKLLQQIKNGEVKPLPSRSLTRRQLFKYTGSKGDAEKHNPIYISVRGLVYDVSSAPGFYGPEGPYAAFAGHDATIALAKNDVRSTIGPDDQVIGLESLANHEVESLENWERKLRRKYPIVGYLND